MTSTIDDFDTIIKRLYKRIYGFALHLSGSEQDAADITQETFVRAYRARDRRLPDRNPDAWVFTIAYRCFLDTRKRAKCRPETVSFETLSTERRVFDPADPARTPEEEFLHDKLSAPLTGALASLSDQQRSLIHLAHSEGLSHKELSAVFGCGATTIKTRIHRIHAMLKHHLASAELESA